MCEALLESFGYSRPAPGYWLRVAVVGRLAKPVSPAEATSLSHYGESLIPLTVLLMGACPGLTGSRADIALLSTLRLQPV
jgi:hypothetical protein